MNHPILNRIPMLRRFVDERFLEHRRRSTSVAGFTSAFLAIALFEYRFFNNHIWNWDLLAVAITFAAVKLFMRSWYWFKD